MFWMWTEGYQGEFSCIDARMETSSQWHVVFLGFKSPTDSQSSCWVEAEGVNHVVLTRIYPAWKGTLCSCQCSVCPEDYWEIFNDIEYLVRSETYRQHSRVPRNRCQRPGMPMDWMNQSIIHLNWSTCSCEFQHKLIIGSLGCMKTCFFLFFSTCSPFETTKSCRLVHSTDLAPGKCRRGWRTCQVSSSMDGIFIFSQYCTVSFWHHWLNYIIIVAGLFSMFLDESSSVVGISSRQGFTCPVVHAVHILPSFSEQWRIFLPDHYCFGHRASTRLSLVISSYPSVIPMFVFMLWAPKRDVSMARQGPHWHVCQSAHPQMIHIMFASFSLLVCWLLLICIPK